MVAALTPPVYMLAVDHRWQWEEWCDQHGISRARIPEVKVIGAEAFLAARKSSADVRQSGALLIDLTYGGRGFDLLQGTGAAVGTPAERAGVFPLDWTDVFERALVGTFVKVLVRHRRDQAADIRAGQFARLLQLQEWCASNRRPLVVEVLVTPVDEPEDTFEREGRPAVLAEYIRAAYAGGLTPAYWKIEGVPDRRAMEPIDGAINERPGPKQLVLGKGAGLEKVEAWFTAAAGAASAGGFAIGRTVYWRAATEFLLGRRSREAAVSEIVETYQTVVDMWKRAQQQEPEGRGEAS
jgi:5-dehydro-2-deoxygluconokinase